MRATKDTAELFAKSEKERLAGRAGEQFTRLNETLSLDPEHPEALARRGWALYSRGKKEEGVSDLYRSVDLDPDCHVAWFLTARASFLEGDSNGAFDEASYAIDLSPGDPAYRLLRAEILLDTGNYEASEIIEDLEIAIANSTTEDDIEKATGMLVAACYEHGSSLLADDQYDEAIEKLTVALAESRDEKDLRKAKSLLVKAYYERSWTRDLPADHADFNKAIEIDPDDFQICEKIGTRLRNKQRHAEARPFLEKALGRAPEDEKERLREIIEECDRHLAGSRVNPSLLPRNRHLRDPWKSS